MTSAVSGNLIGTMRVASSARERFGEFLDAVAPTGSRTLLTEGSPWVWDVLRAASRQRDWTLCALVPNVAGYVREATDYGLFGAALRQLRSVGPLGMVRLGLKGMVNVRGVLRRDFPTLLSLLLELEAARFRKVQPRVVFLHPQMTDLLLALDHGAALARAVDRIRRRFGAEVGLATNNLGHLGPKLRTWGVEVSWLLTAMHPTGFGMRPSRESCEQARRAFSGSVLALPEGPLDQSVAAFWRSQSVTGGVYDVADPSPDEWRNWQTLTSPSTGDERLRLALTAAVPANEDRA